MSTRTAGARKPRRKRGGQELPDAVQDRPEQNAGYDAAVRGRGRSTPTESRSDAEVIDLDQDAGKRGIQIEGEEGREGEEG